MELREAKPVTAGSLWDEDARRASILKPLLRVVIVASLMLYLIVFVTSVPVAVFTVVTGTLLVEGAAWLVLRRGRARLAAVILVFGLWLLLTAGVFVAAPQGNAPWIALALVVLAAGVLLGSTTGFVLAGATSLATLVYVVMTNNQALLATPLLKYNLSSVWVVFTVIFLAVAGLVQLQNRTTGEALQQARENAAAQAEANRELEATRQSLEHQVVERTKDLETRSQYLQAAIEVSRATASILDTRRLIQAAVDVIREQFDLYYVGIFLVDPSGEWAVLQAGTGEAGAKMLARNHRIRVGSGMVGWSVANAQPRIALDVGRDVMRLVNPDLPDTQSEASIPLRSRGKVLGAFTVQSTRPDAFGEVEIDIFQSMADQMAIALDNARLIGESQQALEEARRAQGQISRRAWQDFLRSTGQQTMKYRFGQIIAETEAEAGETNGDGAGGRLQAARREVIRTRKAVQVAEAAQTGQHARSTLLLPIPVRDQVVGVISFVKESDTAAAVASEMEGQAATGPAAQAPAWLEDEIELLDTISEQLGVALDSARLYQDTQRLAYREQLAGEVTTRIRQTLDIQTVLRTAVEEVQRSLNLPEVVISLAPPESK